MHGLLFFVSERSEEALITVSENFPGWDFFRNFLKFLSQAQKLPPIK